MSKKPRSVNDRKWVCKRKGCDHHDWQPKTVHAVGHQCINKQTVDLKPED